MVRTPHSTRETADLVTEATLPFLARFVLALRTFFRLLTDGRFAAGVQRLPEGGATPQVEAVVATPAPALSKVHEADPRAALQLLGLFQREGRLLDFLGEDISTFTDAQVGVAARVVHAGCKKALHDHFAVAPIRPEAEGSMVVIEAGFEAGALRFAGNVAGGPPHRGTLQHAGYRVMEIKLPKLHDEHDAHVLAPAEIEL